MDRLFILVAYWLARAKKSKAKQQPDLSKVADNAVIVIESLVLCKHLDTRSIYFSEVENVK